MDLFLIYLLFRFTREKQYMMKDSVLGRDVPSIVFINNQRLIRESCVLRMEHESDELVELKAQAEINEFLYRQLKNSGITSRLGEEIGIEFTELYKSTSNASLVKSLITYGSGEFNDPTSGDEQSPDKGSGRSEALIRV